MMPCYAPFAYSHRPLPLINRLSGINDVLKRPRPS